MNIVDRRDGATDRRCVTAGSCQKGGFKLKLKTKASTLLTRAIMAKMAESGMSVVCRPACARRRASSWPPCRGAPSATTTCTSAMGRQPMTFAASDVQPVLPC